MSPEVKKKLERNLILLCISRAFQKRTYLAIIPIFIVSQAGVSLQEIGYIAAITAFVSLVLEVPSGYLSDKLGHKYALVLGSVLVTVSPLFYIFMQNFWGALLGLAVYFGGSAFHSGTRQAFVHDTLMALGKESQFVKVRAREQRWGLMGALVFVVLVPLLYPVNPVYPFVVGSGLLAISLLAHLILFSPPIKKSEVKEPLRANFLDLFIKVWNRGDVLIFVLIGFLTASGNRLSNFRELFFQDVGVSLWLFGVLVALSALAGIVFSYVTEKQVAWGKKKFYLRDALFMCVLPIVWGIAAHPVVGVVLFIIYDGYMRTRRDVIDTFLLRDCPTKDLKATYLSFAAFIQAFLGIITALVIGFVMQQYGPTNGYTVYGLGMLLVVSIIWLRLRTKLKT